MTDFERKHIKWFICSGVGSFVLGEIITAALKYLTRNVTDSLSLMWLLDLIVPGFVIISLLITLAFYTKKKNESK